MTGQNIRKKKGKLCVETTKIYLGSVIAGVISTCFCNSAGLSDAVRYNGVFVIAGFHCTFKNLTLMTSELMPATFPTTFDHDCSTQLENHYQCIPAGTRIPTADVSTVWWFLLHQRRTAAGPDQLPY